MSNSMTRNEAIKLLIKGYREEPELPFSRLRKQVEEIISDMRCKDGEILKEWSRAVDSIQVLVSLHIAALNAINWKHKNFKHEEHSEDIAVRNLTLLFEDINTDITTVISSVERILELHVMADDDLINFENYLLLMKVFLNIHKKALFKISEPLTI